MEQELITFGKAITALKNGKCVARQGWNGKNMYLFQATILNFETLDRDTMARVYKDVDQDKQVTKTIVMKTATDDLCFGWLASQSDIVATDWTIL